ncbi:MAG TPA: LysR family transcriptional regulator [Verrucomicrobiales bacterium]|nr:LysR family transcriptional regulator [Verrucomicrobiales bacterium]
MELRHLRYFVAVAEEENVTRAAARLHVSQPPVSRQIQDLEAELGVQLFERTAKSLKLTEAGDVFYREAQAVLQRADDAVAAVRAVAGGDAGELHVGYAPSLTVQLLPPALRRFRETSPGVKVALHDFSTEQMLAGLRDGSLDAALMVKIPTAALRGLQFRKLVTHHFVVAVPPSHPLAKRRKVPLALLVDERLIAYPEADYPEYHESLRTLFPDTRRRPRIAEEHDSVTSLIAAVESGRGVAVVTESLRCMVGERLVLRPLTPAPEPFCVGIVTQIAVGYPALEKFVQALGTK